MTYAQRLKQIMDKQGVSQAQLVELTGIGKSSISQYLSGKNIPSAQRSRVFADALGVPVEYLLDLESDIDFEGRGPSKDTLNVPVPEAAKIMGVTQQFLRESLINGSAPFGFGTIMQGNGRRFFISAPLFFRYLGLEIPDEYQNRIKQRVEASKAEMMSESC